MVLGGDLDPSGGEVLHRLIGSPVTALELEGLGPQSQTEQLMPQADAEYRHLADQPAQQLDGVMNRRGIPGPVAYEDAVRLTLQHRSDRGRRREDADGAANVDEVPQDVPLDSAVDDDHVVARSRML